jgi:PadR family transcriptional regulator
MPSGNDLQLLQGTLDLLVLRSLQGGPRHGYDVAHWIQHSSDDALRVEDRALYVALHRMEERGWVTAEWGVSENNRRAKYYALTPKGRRALAARTSTWTRYAEAVFKVLAAATG